MKMPYSNDAGQIGVEVRMRDGVNRGGTAYGTILRVPAWNSGRAQAVVTVGGARLELHEPRGAAHVYVSELPRDMDEQGYG